MHGGESFWEVIAINNGESKARRKNRKNVITMTN
jgi:hypothetical protein